ncbi:uncharacterized protein LOC126319998 [Schistocerca gregaria]|uniref:uncharacterized protein LOC126319998 n=1 Tax=Schistocerca gregaria TaxID=7010 RepID=UPI00211F25BB|nr:uncharacterized protein LOC126319998 [Schistocerca gregaria]
MPCYATGLFPLFSQASMQIKPKVIDIINLYFLPLGKHLIPCLNGLIMSLSTGLEETNSELYDTVKQLLDDVCEKVGSVAFYQSIWKNILLNSSVRLGCINYLMMRIPVDSSKDIEVYFPDRNVLVVNALLRSLEDPGFLILRGNLDLLLTHFKIKEQIFDSESFLEIIEKAFYLLIRKDPSLNRRIYGWLLGDREDDESYYVSFAKSQVIEVIKRMIKNSVSDLKTALRSFEIILNLLEKPEVGVHVIPSIFADIMDLLHQYNLKKGESVKELVVYVEEILERLKLEVVWQYTLNLLESADDGAEDSRTRGIGCIRTMLNWIPQLTKSQYLETYFPKLLSALAGKCREALAGKDGTVIYLVLQLILERLTKLREAPVQSSPSAASPTTPLPRPSEELVRAVRTFEEFCTALLDLFVEIFCTEKRESDAAELNFDLSWLGASGDDSSRSDQALKTFDLLCKVIVSFYASFDIDPPHLSDRDSPPSWLRSVRASLRSFYPPAFCTALKMLGEFVNLPPTEARCELKTRMALHSAPFYRDTASHLWTLLSAGDGKFRDWMLGAFLDLQKTCPDICDDVVSESMLSLSLETKVKAHQCFSRLWKMAGNAGCQKIFNKTLFLMLDSLNAEHPILRLVGNSWLTESIDRIEQVFDPVLHIFFEASVSRKNKVYLFEYDCRRIFYAFKVLRLIMECGYDMFMQRAIERPLSREMLELGRGRRSEGDGGQDEEAAEQGACFEQGIEATTYFHIFVSEALGFLSGMPGGHASEEFVSKNKMVQGEAASFLLFLLSKAPYFFDQNITAILMVQLLKVLDMAITIRHLALQVSALRLFLELTSIYVNTVEYQAVEGEAEGIDRMWLSDGFLSTLQRGILLGNLEACNVRFYWLDFLSKLLRLLESRGCYRSIICVSVEVLTGILDKDDASADVTSVFDSLIFLVEFIFKHFCPPSKLSPVKYASAVQAPMPSKSSRITGLFRGFFTNERPSPQVVRVQNPEALLPMLGALDEMVQVFVKIWGRMELRPASGGGGQECSSLVSEIELQNHLLLQNQILRVTEALYDKDPARLMAFLLRDWCYIMINSAPSPEVRRHKQVVLSIVNHMRNTTAASVFDALDQLIDISRASDNKRIIHAAQIRKRGLQFIHAQDAVILDFAYHFSNSRDEYPESTWPAFRAFVKTALNSHNSHAIVFVFPLLDTFLKWCPIKVNKTKKKVQVLIVKAVETALLIANRTFLDLFCDDRTEYKFSDAEDISFRNNTTVDEAWMARVKHYAASQVLAVLRDYLVSIFEQAAEDSKNILYNSWMNTVRHLIDMFQNEYTKSPKLMEKAMEVLSSISMAPAVIDSKIWKKDMIELFFRLPNVFGATSVSQLQSYRIIVNALFNPNTDDIGAWAEFVRQFSKWTGQNIFINAQEMKNQRLQFIKKLVFILISGQTDQYLDYLPFIQEKLVELLRNRDGNADIFANVFLCLRVIFVRTNQNSLSFFWPIIVTELLGAFLEPEPDYVLVVTKFMDLLDSLLLEQFNLYKWMFTSDQPCDSIEGEQLFVPLVDYVSNKEPYSAPVDSAASKFHFQESVAADRRATLTITVHEFGFEKAADWKLFLNQLRKYSQTTYEKRIRSLYPVSMDEVEEFILADLVSSFSHDARFYATKKITAGDGSDSKGVSAKKGRPDSPAAPEQQQPSSRDNAQPPGSAQPAANEALMSLSLDPDVGDSLAPSLSSQAYLGTSVESVPKLVRLHRQQSLNYQLLSAAGLAELTDAQGLVAQVDIASSSNADLQTASSSLEQNSNATLFGDLLE